MKKSAGDIIILHMCTKNQNHMKYGSWDLEWDRQNFLSFMLIFCPFTPITTSIIKIKKKKKEKKSGCYHFIQVHHKWKSYDAWFLRYGAQEIFFLILGHFLIFYPTNNLKNQNIEKMKKSTWRYHHFIHVYQKSWSCYTVPEIVWHDRCKFYFYFWAIFCSFTTLTARKIKI